MTIYALPGLGKIHIERLGGYIEVTPADPCTSLHLRSIKRVCRLFGSTDVTISGDIDRDAFFEYSTYKINISNPTRYPFTLNNDELSAQILMRMKKGLSYPQRVLLLKVCPESAFWSRYKGAIKNLVKAGTLVREHGSGRLHLA